MLSGFAPIERTLFPLLTSRRPDGIGEFPFICESNIHEGIKVCFEFFEGIIELHNKYLKHLNQFFEIVWPKVPMIFLQKLSFLSFIILIYRKTQKF